MLDGSLTSPSARARAGSSSPSGSRSRSASAGCSRSSRRAPPTRARRSARAAPSRRQVHQLLNDRFKEGHVVDRDDRLPGQAGLDLRAHGRDRGTAGQDLRDADAAGPRRRRFARAASSAATSATRSGRRRRRRRSRPTTRRAMVLLPVFNGKDDTESMVRDVTALREHPPGADGTPAGRVRHRPGRLRRRSRARRRGHRRDAAGDHGAARPRPDAAHLPLAVDRGADAGRRGRGLPRRDRAASTAWSRAARRRSAGSRRRS